MITSESHELRLIKEKDGIRMYEIVEYTGRSEGFFLVYWDAQRGQVSTTPADPGCWYAGLTPFGVSYVASPRSRRGAQRYFKKLTGA